MIWVILTILFFIIGGIGWYLFYRSAKVMFDMDQIFGELGRVLTTYSHDLTKMTGGDLLLDHPEVRAFHRRNLLALEEINVVLEEIKKGRPEAPKETLPRPDVG